MNERIKKIKNHFQENQKVYIGVSAGVVVGVAATVFVHNNGIYNILNSFNFNWKSTNMVIADLARRGHPGYTIMCNETGVPFPSQNYAAKCMNLDPAELSRHLNGARNQVGGFTFTRIRETQ